jgi:hypothetical protein
MTGNASCQQFGVDAMMSSSCFVSSNMVGAEAATMVHVPEYMPHDGSLGVVEGFLAGDLGVLADQLQLARPAAPHSVSPEEAYSVASGYGPSPSDVTVALQPTAAMLAGEPERNWILQEQYNCPTWFSGDSFGDPFTAAARELSIRLAAESSSTGTVVNLPDHSSDVSCSGLRHASSSAVRSLLQPPPYCHGGGDELKRARPGHPHFSQVLSRSGYAHIVQQTLEEFTGCLLQDVVGATGSVVAEAHCPLPSWSSSITTPSSQSMFASSEEHAHQKPRNDLLKLLQLVSS